MSVMPLSPIVFGVLLSVLAVWAAPPCTIRGITLSSFVDPDAIQSLVSVNGSSGSASAGSVLNTSLGDFAIPNTLLVSPTFAVVLTQSALQINTTSYCVVFLTLADGTLQTHCSSNVTLDNIAFDAATGLVFVSGFDVTMKIRYVYQVDLNHGLSALFPLPGGASFVQPGMGAYSAKLATWVLAVSDADGNSLLMAVHMDTKRSEAPVPLPDGSTGTSEPL